MEFPEKQNHEILSAVADVTSSNGTGPNHIQRSELPEDGNDRMENQILPVGPALPPGNSMIFPTNFFFRTRLRIVNDNIHAATVSVNGTGHFVPKAEDSVPGILDLTKGLNFGRQYTVANQCQWVLRIEY